MDDMNKATTCDVVVIGAGFCGSVIAIAAEKLGLSVKVFDANREYADHFRAEKLETDQIELLVSFDLFKLVQPTESPLVNQVRTIKGDKETVSFHENQRGIDYHDTVNSFRDALSERELLEVRRVTSVRDTPEYCEILFHDETTIRTKLLVLATGMEASLRKSLGLIPAKKNNLISTTFGFDIESQSPEGFPFSAFNFQPFQHIDGLHYVTFFPVGGRMRANLFTNWDPANERGKNIRADALIEVQKLFPNLESRIGPFRISSKVQTYTTRYYRQAPKHLHRTVLVGDAYQSVNPANGMGLSKCLVDAEALVNLLPTLRDAPENPVALKSFYENKRKIKTDNEALRRWRWAVESATSLSLKTKLKKMKQELAGRVRSMSRKLLPR
jgi:2-polyprenyl-6-methoxyphenol hydroxylase-like FAD-dependent oxidoreductase